MYAFETWVIVVLVCVAVFQAWLTRRVWRSNQYDRRQKIMQTELVWLLPIIGASLVLYVLHEDKNERPTSQANDR
jgi:hypothetical protein